MIVYMPDLFSEESPARDVKQLDRKLIIKLLYLFKEIKYGCSCIVNEGSSDGYEERLAYKFLKSYSLLKLLEGVVYGIAKPKFRKIRVFA